MLTASLKIRSGGDVPKKLIAVMREVFKDKKKLFAIPWAGFATDILRHCTVDVQRGMIVATFNNLGKDLQRFASDTSRLPQQHRAINKNDEGRGRRTRIFAQGNRLVMEIAVDDPHKVLADYKNRRESPLKQVILDMFRKHGLKESRK